MGTDFVRMKSMKVPPQIRRKILSEKLIDTARVSQEDPAFIFLFDAYSDFVDTSRELSDFSCMKCRHKVMQEWKDMKTYLEQLENPK